MRIISFNVNGVRAITKKTKNGEYSGGFSSNVLRSLIDEQKPDILCLQEIKTQRGGDMVWLKTFYKHIYINYAKHKKGYSGVAVLTNIQPEWVSLDFNRYPENDIGPYLNSMFNHEGRIITLKFPTCVLINVYTPNSQPALARLTERLKWEQTLRNYLSKLGSDTNLPIVLCCDMNCAPQDIDVYSSTSYKNNQPCLSTWEKAEFQKLIDLGFIDSFRYLYPNDTKFTHWFPSDRISDQGWRIDMILVSVMAKGEVFGANCLKEYNGSDHCPIVCDLFK